MAAFSNFLFVSGGSVQGVGAFHLSNPICEHGILYSSPFLSFLMSIRLTVIFPHLGFPKEMATHSSALAWRIPWTEEPGGLPSMGSHRVGHD